MKLSFVDRLKHFALYVFDYGRSDAHDGDSRESSLRLQRDFQKKSSRSKGNFGFLTSRRKQSLSDSQGVSGFIGSAYNGAGNVDNDKIRSNKPRLKNHKSLDRNHKIKK